jgi:hypothetical protein
MAMSPTKVIYHAPGHPTNQEKAGRGGRQPRRLRQGWSHPELTALAIVASAIAGFAIYGVTTGAPSTVGYLGSVLAVTAVVVRLRHAPVSPALALSLGLLAVAHLAGGLVRVGDGVLYNAQFGSEVFRYDHLVHSSAVFVGTLVVYALFARQDRVALRRGPASVALWVLAGLGLGAVNETVEFLATILQDGSQVGGYTNTGWDLVSNVVGTIAAGVFLSRNTER